MSMIGIDVGTSALKGLLINDSGEQLALARAGYSQTFPKPGWCEQDPHLVEAALRSVISELAHAATRRGDRVRAVSMSVSGNEATLIDDRGEVLRPTIMSMDARGTEIVSWWSETVGRQLIYETTGIAVHPMHALVRLMWLRENEPSIFNRIDKSLGWGEYLAGRLGVQPAADYSMTSGSMAFDIRSLDWSDILLTHAQIDRNLFAATVPTGSTLGTIDANQARSLGLGPDVVVAAGGFDQAMAALGSGLIDSGDAGVGTGSWEALVVITDNPRTTPELLDCGYMSACYVTPGKYFTVANNSGGGSVLQWLADTLGAEEQREAQRLGVDHFDLLLSQCSSEPSGLLVVPHFAGSFNPWMDPRATGAIVGLTLSTSKVDVIRGFIEGITYEFRENLERLEAAGISVNNLVATGGGAKSDLWVQIRADIVGRPISTVTVKETGCFAAACVAGTSIGVFNSTAEAIRALVKPDRTFEPNSRLAERYDELFANYQRVYPGIAGIDPYASIHRVAKH